MAKKPELPATTQRIGILVFDGFEPIDVFGFAEAFAIARFLGQGYAAPPPYPFETVLIAMQVATVKSINGPSVMPDWDFAQALKEPLDVLLVPGGGGIWRLLDEEADPKGFAALLDWMRAMDKKVRIMASVCTGAAVLAKCGFLDGLPAATNHSAFTWVAQQARGCSGTTSRDRWCRQVRLLRRGLGRHRSRLLWYRGWPVGRSPKSRRRRPNTIGTAIRTSRSSIRSKPAINGAPTWIRHTSSNGVPAGCRCNDRLGRQG